MIAALSVILLTASLAGVFRYRNDILHPAFWTNVGFVGYAIGGLFFSIFGFNKALFLNLAKFGLNDREYWFAIALLIAGAGLCVFNLGFFFADKHVAIRKAPLIVSNTTLPPPIVLLGKVSAIILIALGLAYYVYFANRVAGGILPMVGQVGAYPHLVEAAGLSSLPFHLLFGGALLWLMMWLSTDRHRWIGFIFIPIGALVTLSTGRIAAANAYLFSAVLFYAFVVTGRAGWKTFATGFICFLPINIVYYFFRDYTSYAYIGTPEKFPLLLKPDPTPPWVTSGTSSAFRWLGDFAAFHWLGDFLAKYWSKTSYILQSLIGGGNIPDLQQLILIVSGLTDGRLKLEYGATYFDWLVNLIESRVGFSDTNIQSVGYRILHAYFPAKNGGPTPGMIGEAILNFGVFAPVALFAIAYSIVRIYAAVARSESMFFRLIYCQFLVNTWALLLKVDSSLLQGYLWLVAPIAICWLGLLFLGKLVTKYSSSGAYQRT
jgi:hypothetical protein